MILYYISFKLFNVFLLRRKYYLILLVIGSIHSNEQEAFNVFLSLILVRGVNSQKIIIISLFFKDKVYIVQKQLNTHFDFVTQF